MGLIPERLFEPFRALSLEYLRAPLASGEYIGWLVSEKSQPQKILAGAGVLLRQIPPFPLPNENGETTIAAGRQGVVVNVFTEPEWRRRGLARLLMEQIVTWARKQGIESLVLHASDDGRALYKKLGFIDTNEMRMAALVSDE